MPFYVSATPLIRESTFHISKLRPNQKGNAFQAPQISHEDFSHWIIARLFHVSRMGHWHGRKFIFVMKYSFSPLTLEQSINSKHHSFVTLYLHYRAEIILNFFLSKKIIALALTTSKVQYRNSCIAVEKPQISVRLRWTCIKKLQHFYIQGNKISKSQLHVRRCRYFGQGRWQHWYMRGDKITGYRGAESVTKIKINETSPLVASSFFQFTPQLCFYATTGENIQILMAHNVVLSFGEIYK